MSVASRRAATAALALLVFAVARPCFADQLHPIVPPRVPRTEPPPPPRLVWRWPRFRTEEYYATGIAGLLAAGSLAIPASPGRWRGGILFDEDARDALEVGTYQGRRAARDASDVMVGTLVAYPILVDGVIVSSGVYQSDDVMEQLLLMDTEVIAITSAVQVLTSGLTSRERPYGRDCGKTLSEETPDCQRRSRHQSFFSGHTAVAFAAAGLTCSHHANLSLYGGGVPDVAACGGMLVGAAAMGALRVMGDAHYASDVMVGAGWGSLTGFVLPWLLHYRDYRPAQSGLKLYLVPVPFGAGIGGNF